MKNGIVKMVPVALLFLALIFVPDGAVSAADEVRSLFSSPIGSGSQRWNPDEPWIMRSRLATVNLGRVYESARRIRSAHSFREMFSLNLFEDVTITARIHRVEEMYSGGFVCYGTVPGCRKSEVILVVNDAIVSANIVVPGAFYQVRFAAPGLHRVQEIDQTSFPSERSPIPIRLPHRRSGGFEAKDTGDYIDILVAYTGEAASAAGGTAAIKNNISLMVSETNSGYSKSGVSQRLRLVHTMEVSYSESSFNWSTTLDRFRRTSDGFMDNVHDMRDTYGADAAVLIVNNTGSCGIAYVMQGVSTSFATYAFAVVSRSCATGYYSFGHELGHVMGSGHDRDNASVTGAYDYSFGYQAPDEDFRTIMAYNCPGGCNRVNYWSNPDKDYGGQAMGIDYTDPQAADNRRSLNNTAPTVANFRQAAVVLSVNKDGIGSGTVTSNPAGINCGGDCAQEYSVGDAVTLSASAHDGSTFEGWSGGGCSGTGPCTVTMSSSKTVTATFDKVRVDLTVEKDGNGSGTVTSSPSGINCGEDCNGRYPLDSYVTLYAMPTSDSVFVGWSGSGCSGTGSCRVTMDNAKTVTATFSHSKVSLSIDTGGTGTGNVTSSPTGISCGGDCDHDYSVGDTVTLTASPNTGSTFAGWSGGGCSGTSPCTVTMNSNTAVTALFDKVTFYLQVTKDGNGSGTVTSSPSGIDCGEDCREDFTIGTDVTLTAEADVGSTFAGWSGTGCTGDGPCTIRINGNRAVTACFDLKPSTLIDTDIDGITNGEEQGPDQDDYEYDGNNDGTPDWQQYNVTSFSTRDSWGVQQYVTVEVPLQHRLHVGVEEDVNAPAAGITLPFGVLRVIITGVTPGGSTTATILLDGASYQSYYKYSAIEGALPSWYEFLYDGSTGAQFMEGKILLHFIDGQRGDNDLVADGTITDTGGPVAFERRDVLYLPGLLPADGTMTDVTIVNTNEFSVLAGIDYYAAAGDFVSREEVTVGAKQKATFGVESIPAEAASAIVSAEGDLVGYTRHVDDQGKRSAWPACTRTVPSFSIAHVAAGTWWETGLHLFNPLESDAAVSIVYTTGTSTDLVIQAKSTYSLVVDTSSETTTPTYIETNQPLTAVEFFDCLFPGGDKAALIPGGEARTELVVPNILHSRQGWTGIGIGCSAWDGTVVAFGLTEEDVFALEVVGSVAPYDKVSANLSSLLDAQVPWARLLGVNYGLVSELDTYVVPMHGVGIYGDPLLAKIGAVNLNALRFEHGVLGVVSAADSPTFVVVNPDNSEATLLMTAYGEGGALVNSHFETVGAGRSMSFPLSQYVGNSGDGYIAVEANAPLYGYEMFTVGERMEMLPVLQQKQ